MKIYNCFNKISPFFLIFIVLFIWFIYPFLLTFLSQKFPIFNLSNSWESFGTFGDTYGALNTLFSGLAFAVLILSLMLQRKELQEQRKELEAQRYEIKESNIIADAQREITKQQAILIKQQINDAKIQSFYQLLFKYLDEKNRKLQTLTLGNNSKISGTFILEMFISYFENDFNAKYKSIDQIDNSLPENFNEDILDSVESAHHAINNQFKSSEYFEYIYFILDFIKKHEELNVLNDAIKTFIAFQSIDEMYCMLLIASENEFLYEYIEEFSLLSKISSYEENEILTAIIKKAFIEKAYLTIF